MLILRWLLLCPLVALLAGSASASFLHALALVTGWRDARPWLFAGLPLAGLAIGWAFTRFGGTVSRGTSAVLDEIYEPRAPLPGRMTPMIWLSSVLSHLVGASTGREGAAVQMGASLSDLLSRPFRLGPGERPVLLMTGASAGFASAFGTPWAGALFGLEVATAAPRRWRALLPCAASAFLADRVAHVWGTGHTAYPKGPDLALGSLLAVLVLGLAAGLAARLFSRGLDHGSSALAKLVPGAALRGLLGGLVLAALFLGWTGSTRYAGLGIPWMLGAFEVPSAAWDWAAKLSLTALSLACGFKGGEAMPLFYVGATLGSWLSLPLGLPVSSAAGLGFAACFGAASRTPLSCALLAAELFGWSLLPWSLLACAAAWRIAGRPGIYPAQK